MNSSISVLKVESLVAIWAATKKKKCHHKRNCGSKKLHSSFNKCSKKFVNQVPSTPHGSLP